MLARWLRILTVLELVGAVSVLLGLYARMGAIALLGFLIPVSVIMHDFWAIEDHQQHTMQMIQFMKNLALMGAMLHVIANGPGAWSLDARHRSRAAIADHNSL